MIDTLIIVCYLVVSTNTTTPESHPATCAFDRHKTELRAKAGEVKAQLNEKYQDNIKQLTTMDVELSETFLSLHQASHQIAQEFVDCLSKKQIWRKIKQTNNYK